MNPLASVGGSMNTHALFALLSSPPWRTYPHPPPTDSITCCSYESPNPESQLGGTIWVAVGNWGRGQEHPATDGRANPRLIYLLVQPGWFAYKITFAAKAGLTRVFFCSEWSNYSSAAHWKNYLTNNYTKMVERIMVSYVNRETDRCGMVS